MSKKKKFFLWSHIQILVYEGITKTKKLLKFADIIKRTTN